MITYVKRIACLLSLLVGSTAGLEAMARHDWYAGVVPMSYNKSTNEWNVLLGLEKYWTDFFYHPTKQGQSANEVAEKALAAQTNDVYKVRVTSKLFNTKGGNPLFFVVVPYKSADELRRTAANKFRRDFVWIPASDFNKRGDISYYSKVENKAVNVDRRVKDTIAEFLPKAIAQQR